MPPTTTKPNLLFVWADQLRLESTGFGGSTRVATPHLDRFAQASVNFTNAVSNTPVCAPFRACALTGRFGHTNGVVTNGLRLPESEVTFGEILKAQGYRTGYVGKWHLSGVPMDHEPPGAGRHGFDDWSSYEFYHNHNHTRYWQDDETPIEPEGYQADVETDLAIEFLDKQATASDEPFCLFLSWGPPHPPYEPWILPPKYLPKFGTVEPLPRDQWTPDAKDWRWRDWQTPLRFTPHATIPLKENAHGQKHTDMMAAIYHAQTEWIDDCFGQLMDALEARGLADNTIVVFTSDHGEMLGSHGLRGKMIFYDESVRIPCLIRWPGQIPAGGESDACISSVDFLPTLLGLMDTPCPEGVEGMNLAHCAKGEPGDEPAGAIIASYTGYDDFGRGWEYRGIRTKKYTYARSLCEICHSYTTWDEDDHFSRTPERFLFDNQSDPLQQNNLIDDPTHQPTVAQLEAHLQNHLKTTNDKFLTGPEYKR